MNSSCALCIFFFLFLKGRAEHFMKQLGLKNLQKRQAFSRSIELVEVYLGTSIMLKRDVAAGKKKNKKQGESSFCT